MRIIAGTFRGRRLKSPPSLETRPTSDRLRETLFNILAPRIESARLLDLCAGSGAVGIEALSRGAEHVTFVDRSRRMCALVRANLGLCQVPKNQATVISSDAVEFLQRQIKKGNDSYNVVYFDPPYADDYSGTLELIGNSNLITAGVLILEHERRKALPEAVGKLRRYRVLKQGDSTLSFYSRA